MKALEAAEVDFMDKKKADPQQADQLYKISEGSKEDGCSLESNSAKKENSKKLKNHRLDF